MRGSKVREGTENENLTSRSDTLSSVGKWRVEWFSIYWGSGMMKKGFEVEELITVSSEIEYSKLGLN